MKKTRLILAGLLALTLSMAARAESSALNQLKAATNGQQTTGTTFDGCKSYCGGIDTTVSVSSTPIKTPNISTTTVSSSTFSGATAKPAPGKSK